MNDLFERRVRAAAVAGWWSLLCAVLFLTSIWLIFQGIMSARPAWILSLWGPDISWEFILTVTIWAVAIFKIALWLLAVVVLWLTLWARQLRKTAS